MIKRHATTAILVVVLAPVALVGLSAALTGAVLSTMAGAATWVEDACYCVASRCAWRMGR